MSRATINVTKRLRRLIPVEPGFLSLLIGTTVSELGSTLSMIALPTFAVTSLHASSGEAAAIYVVQWIPILFSTLSIGKAVDRFNRLILVIIADLVAAVAAFLASWLIIEGSMSLYWLVVVLFIGAACSTLYEVAAQALVPQLLGNEALVSGNSRLLLGQSVAKIAGQGLATRLLAVNSGALVLLLDGISFLIRAGLLYRVRGSSRQLSARRPVARQSLAFEELEYLRARADIVRIIASQATLNAGGAIIGGLFLVYAYRTLHLAPYHIALMLMAGSIASVITSLMTTRIAAALGAVRTAALALVGSAVALWLILLAREVAPLLILFIYQMGFSICSVLYHVCLLSYRQQVTPAYMHGRIASIDATINAIAVIGGLLFATLTASVLRLEGAILVGCVIASLSPIWLIGLTSTARGAAASHV